LCVGVCGDRTHASIYIYIKRETIVERKREREGEREGGGNTVALSWHVSGRPYCLGRSTRGCSADRPGVHPGRAGRPDVLPGRAGRPDVLPGRAGRPDVLPSRAGQPDVRPGRAGRPDVLPGRANRPGGASHQQAGATPADDNPGGWGSVSDG
jgi:hypothetical protein